MATHQGGRAARQVRQPCNRTRTAQSVDHARVGGKQHLDILAGSPHGQRHAGHRISQAPCLRQGVSLGRYHQHSNWRHLPRSHYVRLAATCPGQPIGIHSTHPFRPGFPHV
ncbi:hypothetical protein AMP9_0792 [plant metagenome]|uniref:Uncharacterized protein n=1 Tax=plant metagenome TaxID=1297885 RepID=A0A484Q1R4_9ZZZZ